MVSRYPYILQVFQVPKLEPSDVLDRDINGNWLPQNNGQYCSVSVCRNGGSNGGSNGDFENVINGVKYVYQFEVFLPKTCQTIPLGAKIRVVEKDGTIRKEGIVMRFTKEQLHSRLWV